MILSEIEKYLFILIEKEIHFQFSIRRKENDLNPYTKEQIEIFIQNHIKRIENMIQDIILCSEENEELNEILEITNTAFVRDYLYEYIELEKYVLEP